MGKVSDLFKKIGGIKWIFEVRMGTIKNRNGRDLTEVKEIKRWQEYREELYKKDLNDSNNCNDVITHLNQTLGCEFKCSLWKIYYEQS